jgi:two-component system sensor histidine kinase RegB
VSQVKRPIPEATLSQERVRINLSWLIQLRWAAVGGQLVTVTFITLALDIRMPLASLAAILAVEGLSNLTLAWWFWKVRRADAWIRWAPFADRLLAFVMAADIFFLTLLLYETGGPTNPFHLFYLANLTLGAVILRARGAWVLTAMACICYASLFLWHVPLAELSAGQPSDIFTLRNRGALTAFTTAAVVIVYFTARVTTALARREADLTRAQQLQARGEKLEALGTLAAGAAHELASPLSTIAVVAKELAVVLQQGKIGPDCIQDAQLIREEVERCRLILRRMAADAGQSVGEALQPVVGGDLLKAIVDDVRDPSRLQVEIGEGVTNVAVLAPMHALAQALRGLIHNSLDASEPSEAVELSATCTSAKLLLEIRDRGHGMGADVLARAGEPFFTTKEPGKGMGLGLFLARTLVERLGGEVVLESRSPRGTIARVTLPIAQ